MRPRRVPTARQVRRAQDLDDAPAAVWAWTLQTGGWVLLALTLAGLPQRVLTVAMGLLFMVAGGGFVALALRAHQLAYDRRRAVEPAASWWEMTE